MNSNNKKQALGRGLGALINNDIVETKGSSSISEVELSLIEANPNQPRTHFDEEALSELSASIKEIGVVQPITLREMPSGKYQIIAGERRCRASKMASLERIPAYIKTVDDESMMEMALVENIQREDLNAIEIALSYQRLIDEYQFTQDKLSDKVGKKRATISNYLRLLKLPAEIQLGIKYKKIDMGHARALVSIDDTAEMIRLYEDIIKHAYSVRKVEEMAHNISNKTENKTAKKQVNDMSDYISLCGKLSKLFGTAVNIERNSKGKGRICLQFSTDDELENLIATFDKMRDA